MTIPLLIIHGEEDRVVTVEHAERLHKAVKRAGGDSEMKIIPGGDHHLSQGGHRIEVLSALEVFFEKHLQD